MLTYAEFTKIADREALRQTLIADVTAYLSEVDVPAVRVDSERVDRWANAEVDTLIERAWTKLNGNGGGGTDSIIRAIGCAPDRVRPYWNLPSSLRGLVPDPEKPLSAELPWRGKGTYRIIWYPVPYIAEDRTVGTLWGTPDTPPVEFRPGLSGDALIAAGAYRPGPQGYPTLYLAEQVGNPTDISAWGQFTMVQIQP